MSKKKKGQKKSLSVNDIPVDRHPQQILNELDNDTFKELLVCSSKPSYNRKSEGCLNETLGEDNKSKLLFLEKTLRDEDDEKERQKKKGEKLAGECDLRRPPSVSPTFSLPTSKRNLSKGCFSAPADQMFDYIDSGADIEMMEMGQLQQQQKPPQVYSKGNEEKICNELNWEGDLIKEPERDRNITVHNPLFNWQAFPQPNLYSRPAEQQPRIRQNLFSKTTTGVMSVTSDCFTDDSVSSGGELVSNPPPFDYALLPRLSTLCPPFETRCTQKGYPAATEKNESNKSNSAVEEKKRKIQQRKAKEGRNSYVVQKGTDCMDEPSIPELVKFIGEIDGGKKKVEDGRQERSRKKNSSTKDINSTAAIGNQQGKAPAAAPNNKPQNNTGTATNPTKENSKKSPNKKNRKGANMAGLGVNAASRTGGRFSTEDGEEEFLSADEGIVSSNSDETNVHLPASDVMMDGANYRADNEDLSCIENHVTEEQEFITVESRDKKKKGTNTQAQRTGSTGKVERRNNQRHEEQPRRNSMEDRVRSRPRPQTAVSLSDYLDDPKRESHSKAKVGPFKESKKKHDRLESTADSEYMDAQDEMALPTPNQNGTGTPERAFSYADVAKKSAEPSRESSPACLNNKNTDAAATSETPSPPPAAEAAAVDSNSPPEPAENQSTTPVSMPEETTEADGAGLSFFYEDEGGSKSEEGSTPGEDNAFVLNLPGKTIKFAMGRAAPVSLQPVDERHRAMVDLMIQRWQLFTTQGPTPTYYTSDVQV